MIVTRQRPKKKSSLPVLLPIAAIAMLVVAVTWPPSRNVIFSGPLRPVATVVLNGWEYISRPLTFAYQQQEITDRNVEIKQLHDRLAAERTVGAAKDAQVQQLRKQIAAAASEASVAATPVPPSPAPQAASGAGGIAASGSGLVNQPDDPVRRTAQQWSAMDPDRAAALATTLPAGFVSAVFAQMSPDSVGPIMDALPAKVAARIVVAGGGPQLSARTSR